MRQNNCYRKRCSSDVSGKVVVVAVEARNVVSRSALVWALTNVAQPGDCIKLLGVIPAICSNKSMWGLSRLATDCITTLRRTPLATVSDQREVCANACSQMVLKLHEIYDPDKIKIRIKVLSGCGAVAAEAKRAHSSWVILDKKLKNEKKYCMEELNCSVAIIERSRPNVLRLNLIGSTNMEQNAFPRNFKGKSEHADTIKGPIVTPATSPNMAAGIIGTSSIPGTNTSPFYQYDNNEGRRRGFSFSQKELKILEEGESNSDSEIILSLSSTSSSFQPWISNAICVDD